MDAVIFPDNYPIKNYRGLSSNFRGGTVGVCAFHRRCGQLPYNLPITHLRFTPRSLQVCLLPNQELSVLYGGLTLNMGDNSPSTFFICSA